MPTHCILTNRFKRGQRVGFRQTAIDGILSGKEPPGNVFTDDDDAFASIAIRFGEIAALDYRYA